MKTFDDMGVSESLGYILVFAIVLTGIAGIVFFGVTMLNDAKDRNNFQNVEQGLTVVQSDLKRVAMEKAPVKTSKLHVEGGMLSTNFTSSSLRVDFNGNVYDHAIGNITYYSNTGLKTLSIENGGLWKSVGYSAGDLGIAPPRIFSSSVNHAIVINVVRLEGTPSSYASSGTMNLVMEYAGNRVYTYTAPVPGDVTITVNTAYPNAWSRFIEESISGFTVTPVSISDSQMMMTISDVSEVIISEHTVNIRPFYITS
ncbi:MAG TPA: hypothetical protein VGJ92_12230 [Methanocella sp.]|jgi:hypothetical protein